MSSEPRTIDLARRPSVLVFAIPLVPLLLAGVVIPFLPPAFMTIALGIAFLGTVLVFVAIRLAVARKVAEYRLVIDERGVAVADADGRTLGRLGDASFPVTRANWMTGSRSGVRANPCCDVGGRLSFGAFGWARPYSSPATVLTRPRYFVRVEEWEAIVAATPGLQGD